MKLKTKLYKLTEKALKELDIQSFSFKGNFAKPEGDIVTHDLDRGYFTVTTNSDDSKMKISFQLLPYEDIIICLE